MCLVSSDSSSSRLQMLTSTHSHCCCWPSASLSSALDSHPGPSSQLHSAETQMSSSPFVAWPQTHFVRSSHHIWLCPDFILPVFSLCSALFGPSALQGTVPWKAFLWPPSPTVRRGLQVYILLAMISFHVLISPRVRIRVWTPCFNSLDFFFFWRTMLLGFLVSFNGP